MTKHYAERDLLEMDRAGDFYGNHVMAMTAEQLHSKSDIAAELGWRDMQIANLKEQLTATTNSLTNAQEALKSAGIEADTVQAGVMELKAQRDGIAALAEERRQFIVNGVETGDITLPVIDADPAIVIYERCLVKPMFAHDAYLNAVRAEGADMLAESLIENGVCTSSHTVGYFKQFAAQLRAGNAGKDGV